jgi:hypothetical protein
MKKQYKRPELVEYGTLQQLTLGQSGNAPDWNILAGVLAHGELGLQCNPNHPHPGSACS